MFAALNLYHCHGVADTKLTATLTNTLTAAHRHSHRLLRLSIWCSTPAGSYAFASVSSHTRLMSHMVLLPHSTRSNHQQQKCRKEFQHGELCEV